jgi:two-component system, chemotaxis family, protein-glutamate methylesterase/glutaminase
MINSERIARDVIVIGGSAGAVVPIIELVAALPRSIPAAIAIVLHRSPFYETRLPFIMGRRASLTVIEANEAEPLKHGVVYLAPRDQHLVIGSGVVRLNRDVKEHRTRPAIDPLFRSAAASYGDRVAGVLLSGMGGDGVSGLLQIKARRGLSLVQSPAEAEFSIMPWRAINDDDVDAVLRIETLAKVLPVIARGEVYHDGRGLPAGV